MPDRKGVRPPDALFAEATAVAGLLRDVSRLYIDRAAQSDIERSGLTLAQVAVLTLLLETGPLSL